jgi:molecular chaperone DnaK (HSP70)
MKLGVDFGTTRIVVAAADRGNYPLVSFETPDGQARDWFPPLVAVRGTDRLFAWDTWNVHGNPQWTFIRSLKRLLKEAGPNTELNIGEQRLRVNDLLVEMLIDFRNRLLSQSTLGASAGEPLEIMLGVPANSNSNQRFLTADAFRAAGFEVLGILNEPSAASVEFGHRDRAARKAQQGRSLLVYDLGGGTFDASLVELEGDTHTVVATAGVSDLGGDDFDEILAEVALETAELPQSLRDALSPGELFRLYDECRERKESLNPNTRKIVIDLERVREGWGEVSVAASVFYERCRALIERTEEVVQDLIASYQDENVDTLYVTGGGSELPAVGRVLKETFGRRVRRSAYMRSATAIGLAIAADSRSGYVLKDRFSQYFGLWRESDHGENVTFDVLFPRGLELPAMGRQPVHVSRSYHPAHNVGHFRYVESSGLGWNGQPSGDLTIWDEIRFPFDPALRENQDLLSVPVARAGDASLNWIEEEYSCDASGMVKVLISNRTAGYAREYSLGRWSGKPVPPAREPAKKSRLRSVTAGSAKHHSQ